MPACRLAAARPASGVGRPALVLALIVPLVATLGTTAISLAERSTIAVHLAADAAQRAGVALDLVVRDDLPIPVLEVRPAPPADPTAAGAITLAPDGGTPPTLLAATRDGRIAALAERPGLDATTLVIASADGTQVRVPFDGLLGAGFAPDGSWLAAIDGRGQLKRVMPDGGVSAIGAGPFLGPPVVEPDGSVLVLAVPSVDAPYAAHLVRVDAVTGAATRLSAEELVYAARPQADGALAVVAHRPDGNVVVRLTSTEALTVAELGPGAVNVSVGASADVIAYERDGPIVVRTAAGERTLGLGTNPRLSADGGFLLADRPRGTVLLRIDGTTIATLVGGAALLDCGECSP